MDPASSSAVSGSFRDPSGFLFHREGVLYRQVNTAYREEYERLLGSGLYEALVADGLLIPHAEVDVTPAEAAHAFKIIQPEPIPFISYPYEWCFSQLQDAALATLTIQKRALEFGMSLKDASAYNIQFRQGRPVLIDTLSFACYQEGEPWVAYRQFCQHFLAPLALMSQTDVRLSQLLRVYIDGVPLDLASALLPWRTRLRFPLLTHIHMHAASQKRMSDRTVDTSATHKISRMAHLGLIDSLESAVRGCTWRPQGTEWADYYTATNYAAAALEDKGAIVARYLEAIAPSQVWDLGANTGMFSRIASERAIPTVAFDIDPAAVEQNYRACRARDETHLLPLVIDLTNPSPGLGWAHHERMSFVERGPVDTVLALALIHHLAISNNVPLERVASFFADICHALIIEFVPKSDSQVQRLLATRVDIFDAYTPEGFERAFGRYFRIVEAGRVQGSERTVYRMERSAGAQ
ncbi:MAG: methyltransferase domain-containing protein [Anaerolineae bacterium]